MPKDKEAGSEEDAEKPPTWEQADAFFKEEALIRQQAWNLHIRRKIIGKEPLQGAHEPLPDGTLLAHRFEVLKHLNANSTRTTPSFVHLATRGPRLAGVKVARANVAEPDYAFLTVVRELLVWRSMETFFHLRHLNSPVYADDYLDFRLLSFPGVSYSFQDLIDKYHVLPTGLILLAAIDSLLGLKQMHDCGFVHRQVRPRHICLGFSPGGSHGNCCYLIDLSEATPFVHFEPKPEVPHVEHEPDRVFDSTDVLNGKQFTRRDDLLSWIYTIMAMRGGPFWKEKGAEETARLKDEICEEKLFVGFEPLSAVGLCLILVYLRQLKPHQRPDYHFILQSLVASLAPFCPKGVPPALPEKEIHVFKLHKFESDIPAKESMAYRFKLAQQPSIFSYPDEYAETPTTDSVQALARELGDVLKSEKYAKMFKRIKARMVKPKGF
ncbi:Protein kinase domain-containing protein [Aphelenchoides fujianensis]|nr:Protein kinase domain-containing protein [Aphelenchoides fujianensis]